MDHPITARTLWAADVASNGGCFNLECHRFSQETQITMLAFCFYAHGYPALPSKSVRANGERCKYYFMFQIMEEGDTVIWLVFNSFGGWDGMGWDGMRALQVDALTSNPYMRRSYLFVDEIEWGVTSIFLFRTVYRGMCWGFSPWCVFSSAIGLFRRKNRWITPPTGVFFVLGDGIPLRRTYEESSVVFCPKNGEITLFSRFEINVGD